MIRRILAFLISFCLIFEQAGFAQVAIPLGIPGYLSSLAPAADKFRPIHLRSIDLDSGNGNFELILDKGDLKDIKPRQLEETTQELYQYFQVGLALPNKYFWVNLRPDSPDEVIEPLLEKTGVGRVMLAADLQLKKDLANATSPQTPEGRLYWDRLYAKASELYDQQDIQIPTLTRPWIVPGEIVIRSRPTSPFIYKATLKVMLEQDYLKDSPVYNFKDPRQKELNNFSSQLIRELIIPKLTREVNSSRRYSQLRQVYYSLILAQWFKNKSHVASRMSQVDSKDLSGLTSKTPWSKDTYYQAYRRSFQKGEYSRQEQVNSVSGPAIRQYFSGGITLMNIPVEDWTEIANPVAGIPEGIRNFFDANQEFFKRSIINPRTSEVVFPVGPVIADSGQKTDMPAVETVKAAAGSNPKKASRLQDISQKIIDYEDYLVPPLGIGAAIFVYSLSPSLLLWLIPAGVAAVAILGAELAALEHRRIKKTDPDLLLIARGNPLSLINSVQLLALGLDGIFDMPEVRRSLSKLFVNLTRVMYDLPTGLIWTAMELAIDYFNGLRSGENILKSKFAMMRLALQHSSGINPQKVMYMLFSNWCFARDDVERRFMLYETTLLHVRSSSDLAASKEDTFRNNTFLASEAAFYHMLRQLKLEEFDDTLGKIKSGDNILYKRSQIRKDDILSADLINLYLAERNRLWQVRQDRGLTEQDKALIAFLGRPEYFSAAEHPNMPYYAYVVLKLLDRHFNGYFKARDLLGTPRDKKLLEMDRLNNEQVIKGLVESGIVIENGDEYSLSGKFKQNFRQFLGTYYSQISEAELPKVPEYEGALHVDGKLYHWAQNAASPQRDGGAVARAEQREMFLDRLEALHAALGTEMPEYGDKSNDELYSAALGLKRKLEDSVADLMIKNDFLPYLPDPRGLTIEELQFLREDLLNAHLQDAISNKVKMIGTGLIDHLLNSRVRLLSRLGRGLPRALKIIPAVVLSFGLIAPAYSAFPGSFNDLLHVQLNDFHDQRVYYGNEILYDLSPGDMNGYYLAELSEKEADLVPASLVVYSNSSSAPIFKTFYGDFGERYNYYYSEDVVVFADTFDSQDQLKQYLINRSSGELSWIIFEGDPLGLNLKSKTKYVILPKKPAIELFRENILEKYGFTPSAAEYIRNHSDLIFEVFLKDCRGYYNPNTQEVHLEGLSEEVAIHEFDHVLHDQKIRFSADSEEELRKLIDENRQFKQDFIKAMVRLAKADPEVNPEYAAAIQEAQTYVFTSWRNDVPDIDKASWDNIDNWTAKEWDEFSYTVYTEYHASLISFMGGKYKKLPQFMWRFYEPFFTGEVKTTPDYMADREGTDLAVLLSLRSSAISDLEQANAELNARLADYEKKPGYSFEQDLAAYKIRFGEKYPVALNNSLIRDMYYDNFDPDPLFTDKRNIELSNIIRLQVYAKEQQAFIEDLDLQISKVSAGEEIDDQAQDPVLSFVAELSPGIQLFQEKEVYGQAKGPLLLFVTGEATKEIGDNLEDYRKTALNNSEYNTIEVVNTDSFNNPEELSAYISDKGKGRQISFLGDYAKLFPELARSENRVYAELGEVETLREKINNLAQEYNSKSTPDDPRDAAKDYERYQEIWDERYGIAIILDNMESQGDPDPVTKPVLVSQEERLKTEQKKLSAKLGDIIGESARFEELIDINAESGITTRYTLSGHDLADLYPIVFAKSRIEERLNSNFQADMGRLPLYKVVDNNSERFEVITSQDSVQADGGASSIMQIPGKNRTMAGNYLRGEEIAEPDVISLKNIVTGRDFELRRISPEQNNFSIWIGNVEIDSLFEFDEDEESVSVHNMAVSSAYASQGIGLTVLQYLAERARIAGKDLVIYSVISYAVARMCYEHISQNARYRINKENSLNFEKIDWFEKRGPIRIRIADQYYLNYRKTDGSDELDYLPSKNADPRASRIEDQLAEMISVRLFKDGRVLADWKSNEGKSHLNYQVFLSEAIPEILIKNEDIMPVQVKADGGSGQKDEDFYVKAVKNNLREFLAYHDPQAGDGKTRVFHFEFTPDFLVLSHQEKKEIFSQRVMDFADNLPVDINRQFRLDADKKSRREWGGTDFIIYELCKNSYDGIMSLSPEQGYIGRTIDVYFDLRLSPDDAGSLSIIVEDNGAGRQAAKTEDKIRHVKNGMFEESPFFGWSGDWSKLSRELFQVINQHVKGILPVSHEEHLSDVPGKTSAVVVELPIESLVLTGLKYDGLAQRDGGIVPDQNGRVADNKAVPALFEGRRIVALSRDIPGFKAYGIMDGLILVFRDTRNNAFSAVYAVEGLDIYDTVEKAYEDLEERAPKGWRPLKTDADEDVSIPIEATIIGNHLKMGRGLLKEVEARLQAKQDLGLKVKKISRVNHILPEPLDEKELNVIFDAQTGVCAVLKDVIQSDYKAATDNNSMYLLGRQRLPAELQDIAARQDNSADGGTQDFVEEIKVVLNYVQVIGAREGFRPRKIANIFAARLEPAREKDGKEHGILLVQPTEVNRYTPEQCLEIARKLGETQDIKVREKLGINVEDDLEQILAKNFLIVEDALVVRSPDGVILTGKVDSRDEINQLVFKKNPGGSSSPGYYDKNRIYSEQKLDKLKQNILAEYESKKPDLSAKDGGSVLDLTAYPKNNAGAPDNIREYQESEHALKRYIIERVRVVLGQSGSVAGREIAVKNIEYKTSGADKDIFKVTMELSKGGTNDLKICLVILRPFRSILGRVKPVSDLLPFEEEFQDKRDLRADAADSKGEVSMTLYPELYDVKVAQVNGLHFYLQEWVEGPTISELMERRALTTGEMRRIIAAWMAIGRMRNAYAMDPNADNIIMREDASLATVDFGQIRPIRAQQGNIIDRLYGQYYDPIKEFYDLHGREIITGAFLDGIIDGLGQKKGMEFLENAFKQNVNRIYADKELIRDIKLFLEKKNGATEENNKDGGELTEQAASVSRVPAGQEISGLAVARQERKGLLDTPGKRVYAVSILLSAATVALAVLWGQAALGIAGWLAAPFVISIILNRITSALNDSLTLVNLTHRLLIKEEPREPVSWPKDINGREIERPVLAVQIACRNENFEIVQRAIENALAVKYPRDRIEIHIVDDSDPKTDAYRELSEYYNTSPLIERRKRESGDNAVRFFHRDANRGYKSGALNDAYRQTKAQYFLIYDADSLVSEDIGDLIPLFLKDKKLGFVHTNINKTNTWDSPYTLAIDISDYIQRTYYQPVKFQHGFPYFHGHNGIVSRAALDAVNGWPEDQPTEDWDFSIQAAMKGFHGMYLPEVKTWEQVPDNPIKLMVQRLRWGFGTIWSLMARGKELMKSDLDWNLKLDIMLHTYSYVSSLPAYALRVVFPFFVLGVFYTHSWAILLNPYFLALSGLSALSFGLLAGNIAKYGEPGNKWRDLKNMLSREPLVAVVNSGISFIYARGVVAALKGDYAGFKITPKDRTPPERVLKLARQYWTMMLVGGFQLIPASFIAATSASQGWTEIDLAIAAVSLLQIPLFVYPFLEHISNILAPGLFLPEDHADSNINGLTEQDAQRDGGKIVFADAENIRQNLAAALALINSVPKAKKYTEEEFWAEARKPASRMLFNFADGRLVALIWYYDNTDQTIIWERMATAASYRRQGRATALLLHLAEHIAPGTTIKIRINEANETFNLYERWGFEREPSGQFRVVRASKLIENSQSLREFIDPGVDEGPYIRNAVSEQTSARPGGGRKTNVPIVETVLAGDEPSSLARSAIDNGFIKKGEKILSLGSGNGNDEVFFAKHGCDVLATDNNPEILKHLIKKAADVKNLSVLEFDVEKPFAMADGSFDVVYLRLVLHYFNNSTQNEIINQVHRILKPGGRAIIELKSDKDALYQSSKKSAQEDGMFYFPEKGYSRNHLGLEELKRRMEGVDFEIIDSREYQQKLYSDEYDSTVITIICKKKDNNASGRDGGSVDPGGVDFRQLPVDGKPGITPALMPQLQKIAENSKMKDLDREWSQIRSDMLAPEMPYNRIKEYIAVCLNRPGCRNKLDQAVSCIIDILRMEEDQALPTNQELKDILMYLS